MLSTQQEIMDFIEEYDVKFIRLAFFDLLGRQKNISVMPRELPAIFENGLCFDASAINGFSTIDDCDLFLHPDTDTLCILPWRPQHGRVVRMYCDIKYSDGRGFELDGRALLKKIAKQIMHEGYEVMAGTECEFYLFERDENGKATKIPYDYAGYCDIAPLDKGENVRREICLDLEEMNILPECSHHEQGPGQNEIDFRFDDVLSTCDNLMTFHNVVDMVALMNGLKASFEPKPLANKPGNGLHLNISLFQDGVNLFGLKDTSLRDNFIAGIIKHIKEITLFLNPCTQSYLRLGSEKAPKYICYSQSNRSSLIRIPAAAGRKQRIELRSGDPMANPYLVFALVLKAGMDGIKNHLLVDEVKGNVYEEHDGLDKLPESLDEAIMLAKESSFVKEILGEKLVEEFINSIK